MTARTRTPRTAALHLALALVALPAACALRAEEGARLGIQLTGNAPVGDSDFRDGVDNKVAPGFGLHLSVNLRDGHMLRPRVDYLAFPSHKTPGNEYKVSDLSVGVDYLYFPLQKPEGFYLTVGAAGHRWRQETSGTLAGGTPYTLNNGATKFGWSAGFGVNPVEHVGLEARFVSGLIDGGDTRAHLVQLGVMIRF